ncbi:MAG: ATP-binding protein [Nitrospirae bacterium]|nr:ATP-binding protein [Nitrospirota bacterium]
MPLREFTSKHFSGRKKEIDILQSLAALASSGDANSIILSGKRGIGKTELLKHLFNELFNRQNNTIPFFYTVKTSFASLENFSEDYLSNFILQSLAFILKDSTLVNTGIYSLEDLREIANESEATWAVDIIDNYYHLREKGGPVKLFSFVISVPYQTYMKTGMPVAVIIDDFHKIRTLLERITGSNDKDLWMLFENSIKFRYTPHVLAGFQSELHKMFFEETSLGEHLEIISLSGLNKHDSIKLFRALCEKYSITCETESKDFVDMLCGNPFYITSFIQASRQTVRTISEDDLKEIYVRELTKGKIYTYWTSILKTYITRFELRKPSLNLLFKLCENGTDDPSGLSEILSVKQEDLDYILNVLHIAGILETGFSTIEFNDDQVLIDFIKGLYHKEIAKEPWDKVKDIILGNISQNVISTKTPSFEITIPSTPGAELVAVKSLEQTARFIKMPPDTIGQLQISLVELFSGVLANNGASGESYKLKFILKGNIFSVEILTSQTDLDFADDESRRIMQYIDDIRIEKIMHGSKITMIKGLK